MLPVAIAFGTAWAARGQIGHEYGATWAAAIGIAAVIVLAGRQDWYERLSVIVALGAIAWGSGGMISYGKVVGYGHSADYLNTSYGYLCLMLIGSLYGFLGGGVMGLALEATPQKKPNWATVFTEMFVGGFLVWGFLIFQLEWFMTPPRSELWAASLGAAFALGWYLYRNGYAHALRTAFFSALGAGFGFGFGNFLQRMGHASGIAFNWWNVMEYSIGFFSGLGLAYGIFSNNRWPKTIAPEKASRLAGWIFLIVILPVFNLIEAINVKELIKTGTDLQVANPENFALTWRIITWGVSIAFMFILWFIKSRNQSNAAVATMWFTLFYLMWYILFSNLVSSMWLIPKFNSQHLYWINLLAFWLLLQANIKAPSFYNGNQTSSYIKPFLIWWSMAIALLLLAAFIAVSAGYVNPNAQTRF